MLRQPCQLHSSTWNLLAWLPVDPDKDLGSSTGFTGLDGDAVWRTVFSEDLFDPLVQAVAMKPVNLILLQPRLSTNAD